MSCHYNSLKGKIEAEPRERCEAFLSEAMGSIQEKLDSGHYLAAAGYRELDSELSEAINKYQAVTKNEVQRKAVLDRFEEEKKPLLGQVQKVDRKLTEEKHALEEELSRVKAELENEKRKRKAAEERWRKELLEQLREKFEEGKEFSLEELKEAMEKAKREVEKYSSEGRKEDAERAQEVYEFLKQKYEKETEWSYFNILETVVPVFVGAVATELMRTRMNGKGAAMATMIASSLASWAMNRMGSWNRSSQK